MNHVVDVIVSSNHYLMEYVPPPIDPAASILTGILLASVAIPLGRETGALIVGGNHRGKIRRIRRIIAEDPEVEKIGVLMTMQLGPAGALLTVRIRFRPRLRVGQLESATQRIEQRIREQDPPSRKSLLNPIGKRQDPPGPRRRERACATAPIPLQCCRRFPRPGFPLAITIGTSG